MKTIKHICFLSLALLVWACVKDKPVPIPSHGIGAPFLRKVFVINEGNYSLGNAVLSLYSPNDQSVVEDYYRYQNNAGLGDVFQSMYAFAGKYYLVVNNSNKIVVCDTAMKKIGQISNLLSPRYFLPINQNKAYVSDLYASQIHVIDLKNQIKISSISCKGWTEQMVYANGKVFVCSPNSQYVWVIDAASDKKMDSIQVGTNVYSMLCDHSENIWILVGGDKTKSIVPQLMQISSSNQRIIKQFSLGMNDEPSHLNLNQSKDSLYFLNKGVYVMAANATSLPTVPLIAADNRNFYGLGIRAADNTIYLSDALDYVQKSNIYVYDAKGRLLNRFKAGINANGFYFE